jgi:NAD(P)H dehydrogenase (quinone)
MILVTGATGHLGNATIEFLLKQHTPASQIAALVRDAKKGAALAAKGIALRTGDYFDTPALKKAFEGIGTLVFISSGSIENRVQQHANVINAAKAAGVKHIIYTSVVKATGTLKFFPGIDHFHTEAMLKQSGIPYTIFRNTFYVEVLPMFFGGALETGQWYYAAGDAKANFAARTDMAEALANVARNPSQHVNKTYEITSGRSYTFHEIAGIVSHVTGKQVSYIPIPLEALKDGMKQAGVPEAHIPMYASIAEGIGAGELDAVDNSLEQLLQRKPVDLKEYLPQLLKGSN